MGVATTYNPGSNVALPMSRFNALLLFALVSLVSPAFSADPAPGTTQADDIDPATGLARTTIVRPLGDAPPVPDSRARTPATVQPGQPGRPHIAVALPTASDSLGRLADSVRQGFAAAAGVAGRNAPPVIVTAVANEVTALPEVCREAQARGALILVAGMTRDGAAALTRQECRGLRVLALNEPPANADPNPNLFALSLSLDQEARQVALLAVADGWHSAIVITSPSPLSRRVQEAFEREWTRAAGEVRARIVFSGTADDAPLVRERIASVREPDMVFMALEAPDARAVRPYITGMLPLYSTSLSINPRAESVVNVDLQGARYVEMPWFVQPDHPAVMVYPQMQPPASVEQERLYALGIDAFRLASQLAKGDSRTPLDGVTGRITLESGNVFNRAMIPAEVDGGRVIPLRPQ